MKRLLPLTALMFLAACTPADALHVSEIRLGAEINDVQEIEEQTASFTPDQTAFHAHATLMNVEGSPQITGSWWYANQKIYESQTPVTPEAPVAKFVLQSTQRWPEGLYRFVVSGGGEELMEKEFEVSAQ